MEKEVVFAYTGEYVMCCTTEMHAVLAKRRACHYKTGTVELISMVPMVTQGLIQSPRLSQRFWETGREPILCRAYVQHIT